MPTSRRAVLTIMLVGLVPAFAGTGVFVRNNRQYLVSEATRWRAQGVSDLASHRPDAAVEAFRVALARGGDDPAVRLQLAQALVAAGRTVEAEAHLRTLWADTPGDGVVNLALARLAVRDGDLGEAKRYYHAAIDGAWEQDPATARRDVRLEFARMMLQHDDPTGARAELIILADVVRDDPARTIDVARMLLDAGDSRTALNLARRALASEPSNVDALALAGVLEFRNANYAGARQLLQRAAAERPLSVEAASALRDADDALMMDPLAPRIGAAARLNRLRQLLTTAQQRIDACTASSAGQLSPDLQALHDRVQMMSRAIASSRRVDADDLEDALSLAGAVEQLPDSMCGPSSPADRTVRLIVRAHPAT